MHGYKKTRHAAEFFDVDESFLTKRKGSDFVLGIHYFVPCGAKILRWDLAALEEWFRNSDAEGTDDLISQILA